MTALHDGTLTLGTVTLGETDSSGVEWILEKLTGWSDTPASTGSVEQRAADHGGWTSPAYLSSRIIGVEGSLVAASWDAATVALEELMASIPLSTLAPLTVDEGARSLTVDVRQDGDPLTERRGGWARFSLSLIAPDPSRYSASLVTASTGLPLTTGGFTLPIAFPFTIGASIVAGVLSVVNGGNMPARPVFTVTGPCPPFSLTLLATGQTLSYPESVAAGRFVVLDTSTRTALLDGTTSRFVSGSWFEYAPGVNEVAFSAESYDAAALLTSEHRDAFR